MEKQQKSAFLSKIHSSALCLMLLMSALMIGFTSCGDDEDEIEGGAPYTGVWSMTHIKIVEDGMTEEGDVTPESGLECTLALNDNGTYFYRALSKGDVEEEDELIEESGTWTFSGKVLTLKNQYYISRLDVLTWTSSKLVTYQEMDGDSETRTWKRI